MRTGVARFEHLSPGEILSWDQVEHAEGGSRLLSFLTGPSQPLSHPLGCGPAGLQAGTEMATGCNMAPLTLTPRRKHKTSLAPCVLGSTLRMGTGNEPKFWDSVERGGAPVLDSMAADNTGHPCLYTHPSHVGLWDEGHIQRWETWSRVSYLVKTWTLMRMMGKHFKYISHWSLPQKCLCNSKIPLLRPSTPL